MAYKLIRLEDGTLVEVEAPEDKFEQRSAGLIEKVDSSVDQIRQILVKLCRPINEAWGAISQEMQIDSAEVELGLSFEAGGDIYLAKAKGSAHFTVKLKLKPLVLPHGPLS